MRWPWSRSEVRESAPYSDAVVASIVSAAGGPSLSSVSATGALEAASSLIARSFAGAEVRSASAQVVGALSPSVLSSIGRSMVRAGEIVFLISTDGGRLSLLPRLRGISEVGLSRTLGSTRLRFPVLLDSRPIPCRLRAAYTSGFRWTNLARGLALRLYEVLTWPESWQPLRCPPWPMKPGWRSADYFRSRSMVETRRSINCG